MGYKKRAHRPNFTKSCLDLGADHVMSYQEEPQSLACTPLETSTDYEMDEVFAEEEPQSLACTPLETSADYEMDEVFAEEEPQKQLAMDICDVAPMEERQKMDEEFTSVLTIKKREKDITLVLKGNEQENTLVIKKSEH